MSKSKVILDPSFRRLANIFSPQDLERLYDAAEIVWGKDDPMPMDEIEKVRDEVVAVIAGSWRHGDISLFPRLKAFLEVSGGFPIINTFDYPYCFAHGIRVLSCAPAFAPSVAEMGLALALACCRQVAWTDAVFRTGEPNWSHTEFVTEIGDVFSLYDKQVGFIGFGGLARALKPLLEPFHCAIQVYDPWLTDSYLRTHGVTPVDLDTLLATSRFIFVLAVPSAANQALLNREKLNLIRPDAVFLLLSRSHVVDFDALTDLLAQGRFRAGIDVFPEEPLPRDHPIRQVKHAVLSSHRAGGNTEGLLKIGRIVTNDIEAIVSDKVPQEMQVAQPEFVQSRGIFSPQRVLRKN